MGALFRVAARNLIHARRRTALLSAALAGVAFLLVLLLSLSQGLTDTIVRSASVLSSGHINIAGFYKAKPSDAFPMVTQRARLREIAANLPHVERIVDRGRGWAKLVSATAAVQVGVSGIDIAEEGALLGTLQMATEDSYREGGRPQAVGNSADLAQEGTVLLFDSQAKRLDVTVGDVITLQVEAQGGLTNTADLRVVAVARALGFMSSWNAYVPKETLRDIYRLKPDTTGAVMIYLDDVAHVPQVLAQARRRFAQEGFELMEPQSDPFWAKFEVVGGEDWTGQKLDITTWEDETSFTQWTVAGLESISAFLVGILVSIIVVGIMNAMWIAVRERTQEIGTLRAIGMQRSQVVMLFLAEALLLGAAASVVGTLGGAGAAIALDVLDIPIAIDAMRAVLMSETLHLVVRPAQLLGIAAVFTMITVLASLWPALRAARLTPVTAIHRVG